MGKVNPKRLRDIPNKFACSLQGSKSTEAHPSHDIKRAMEHVMKSAQGSHTTQPNKYSKLGQLMHVSNCP